MAIESISESERVFNWITRLIAKRNVICGGRVAAGMRILNLCVNVAVIKFSDEKCSHLHNVRKWWLNIFTKCVCVESKTYNSICVINWWIWHSIHCHQTAMLAMGNAGVEGIERWDMYFPPRQFENKWAQTERWFVPLWEAIRTYNSRSAINCRNIITQWSNSGTYIDVTALILPCIRQVCSTLMESIADLLVTRWSHSPASGPGWLCCEVWCARLPHLLTAVGPYSIYSRPGYTTQCWHRIGRWYAIRWMNVSTIAICTIINSRFLHFFKPIQIVEFAKIQMILCIVSLLLTDDIGLCFTDHF